MSLAPPRPALVAPRALKGVALVAGATLLFAVADVLGKYLMTRHPVPVVQAGRYLVNTLLLLAAFYPRHGKLLWRTGRPAMVTGRAVFLAASSLTMGFALQRMPVGETVAVIYLAPFLVMVLAGPLLGETVSPAAWVGAGMAFLGVLLVVRPGTGLDPVGVVFALTNAALSTGYHLMTRVLIRSESTMAMLFHVALTGFAIFAVLALPALSGFAPSLTDLLLIGALGLLATVGHFLFTAAYREAPASLLAPVNYLHLVWATLLGWGVFAHMPDAISLCGMALVVVAGGAVALRASRTG
ncbi:DMT family transporter [Paragemmobacter straminiformis]|uniref:DMT family transporter n=1 Tax=Paragemmobacter straminiformis TaxID=2045119 RepID=A0A842I503_9RHOB|nr:DMT family transporter [Gemmobacter straminiformis]MBC2834204.1 DMT family transporter [Gemmobacter straminiformis]